VNRGTARSNARAVVLPDALLKLDELRGLQEVEDSPSSGSGNEQKPENSASRGPTLLDFVAQALADEEFLAGAAEHRMPLDLKAEAEALRAKALAAKSVCLDEAEANCKQICTASHRARDGLAQLSTGSATQLADRVRSAKDNLGDRVRHICEEAEEVVVRVRRAKEELVSTQQWSSTKGNPKGNDWFGAWAHFFEQLAAAFARTKPPRPAAVAAAATPALFAPAAPTTPLAPRPTLGELRAPSAPPQVATPLTKPQCPGPAGPNTQSASVRAPAPVAARAPAKRGAVMLDDDARAEDMGAVMALLKNPGAAAFQAAGRASCAAGGKENALLR